MEIIPNYKIVIILVYHFQSVLCVSKLDPTNSTSYGPYSIRFDNFGPCKRPKPQCGSLDVSNLHNMSDVIFKLEVDNDCQLETVKMTMGAQQQKQNKTLWSYTNTTKTPCQHFLIGSVISMSFPKINKPTCKIPKGKYVYHIDLVGHAKLFFGQKFFYGRYFVFNLIQNKSHYFSCVEGVMVIEKLQNKL